MSRFKGGFEMVGFGEIMEDGVSVRMKKIGSVWKMKWRV